MKSKQSLLINLSLVALVSLVLLNLASTSSVNLKTIEYHHECAACFEAGDVICRGAMNNSKSYCCNPYSELISNCTASSTNYF